MNPSLPISPLEPRLRCAHLPPRALGSKTFLLPRREAFVAPAALLHAQVPKALVPRVIPGGSCDPWKNLNQTYQKWEALTTFSPTQPKKRSSKIPFVHHHRDHHPHDLQVNPIPHPNSEHSEPIHAHPNGPNLWSVHFRIPVATAALRSLWRPHSASPPHPRRTSLGVGRPGTC